MARRVVIGELRVQRIDREGRAAVVDDRVAGGDASIAEADRFLREHEGSGTQRTYAYLLVDHLRWLERECLRARPGRAAGSAALYGLRGRRGADAAG